MQRMWSSKGQLSHPCFRIATSWAIQSLLSEYTQERGWRYQRHYATASPICLSSLITRLTSIPPSTSLLTNSGQKTLNTPQTITRMYAKFTNASRNWNNLNAHTPGQKDFFLNTPALPCLALPRVCKFSTLREPIWTRNGSKRRQCEEYY